MPRTKIRVFDVLSTVWFGQESHSFGTWRFTFGKWRHGSVALRSFILASISASYLCSGPSGWCSRSGWVKWRIGDAEYATVGRRWARAGGGKLSLLRVPPGDRFSVAVAPEGGCTRVKQSKIVPTENRASSQLRFNKAVLSRNVNH